MNKISRLAQIMDLFSIKGKDLAEHLHVDSSIISKYRNNKRKLPFNSTLADEIAEFFMLLDSPSGYKNIKEIVRAAYPEGGPFSAQTLKFLLSRWLGEDNGANSSELFNKIQYATHITVYQGRKGRMEAAFRLIDSTLSLAEPGEVCILALGDSSQRFSQQDFSERWKNGYDQIISQGHHISVVNLINRDDHLMLDLLSRWVAYVLTGNVTLYYYPRFTMDFLRPNLIILKDKVSIMGISLPLLDEEPLTHFYTDLPTVQHHYQLFQAARANCKPVFEICRFSEQKDFIRTLIDMESHPGDSLISLSLPFFSLRTEKSMKLLLVENNFDIEEIHPQLMLMDEFDQKLQANMEKYSYRYFFDLDEFQKALSAQDYINAELTMALGMPVRLTKDYLQEEIISLIRMLDMYPKFQIALCTSSLNNRFRGINIWTKRNWITIANLATPAQYVPLAIRTKEDTINNAYFRYFDELWSTIPPLEYDRTYVKNKLYQLINI